MTLEQLQELVLNELETPLADAVNLFREHRASFPEGIAKPLSDLLDLVGSLHSMAKRQAVEISALTAEVERLKEELNKVKVKP